MKRFPDIVYFKMRTNKNEREREGGVSLLYTGGKNVSRVLADAFHFLDQLLDALVDLSPLCFNGRRVSPLPCFLFAIVTTHVMLTRSAPANCGSRRATPTRSSST